MQLPQEQWYDIYPQWHVPLWQTSFFFYTVCTLGMLIVCALVWLWLRYRSRTVVDDPYPVVARRALEQLQKSELCNQEYASSFYNALIMVLKKYLSDCYAIDCVSATDQECLALLRNSIDHEEICAMVEQILSSTVAVRFAKEDQGLLQVMLDDIQKAHQIIDLSHIPKKGELNLGA